MRKTGKIEIRYGSSMDIENELYPHNNEVEQTDAELLMQSNFSPINCCSAFESIKKRRFSRTNF